MATLTAVRLDDADTVATLARAAAKRQDFDSTKDLLGVLETLQVSNGGYGLPYEWDAFSDGTVNPTSTVYAYTTALAALAFLDGHQFAGNRHWRLLAEDCAETLERLTVDRPDFSYTWYSDQPADQQLGYEVINISALTLQVYARTGRLGGGLERFLLDTRKPHGWPYMLSGGYNDAFHGALIVTGLATFSPISAVVEWRRLARVHFHAEDRLPLDTHGVYGWGPAGMAVAGDRLGLTDARVEDLLGHDPEFTSLDDVEHAYGVSRHHAWLELARA